MSEQAFWVREYLATDIHYFLWKERWLTPVKGAKKN
jgi:hypothetical protein